MMRHLFDDLSHNLLVGALVGIAQSSGAWARLHRDRNLQNLTNGEVSSWTNPSRYAASAVE